MIETKYGTIRVTYRRSKRKGRVHTIVNFIPRLSIKGVVSSFCFSKEGEPMETNGHDVVTVDVVNDSRDQFNKKDGRKKAIAMALAHSGDLLTKADRTEIWAELKEKIKIV